MLLPRHFIVSGIVFLFSSLMYGQVNPTLQLDGTEGGLVLNRLTNLQRNAIINASDGTIIFNTDSGCLNYSYSNSWYELCGIFIETCDINSDCSSGKICNNGVCINDPSTIACETSEQCPEGFTCINDFCTQTPN